MAGVRDHFLDEGVDEQVLQELRMLWESKLVATKAVDSSKTGAEGSNSKDTAGTEIINNYYYLLEDF